MWPASAAELAQAALLADQLRAPLCSALPTDAICLVVGADGLSVTVPGFANPITLQAGSAEVRRRAAAGRRLELLRACGWPLADKRVLDATAGFGRDAFVLAAAGAQVDMIERDPLLQLLLADALARQQPERLRLFRADAVTLLPQLYDGHELIYLDPMFERAGSALPQREAQLLALLVGAGDHDEQDAGANLLRIALTLAPPRIVVKRARTQAPLLAAPLPAHRVVGRRVRFDVYLHH